MTSLFLYRERQRTQQTPQVRGAGWWGTDKPHLRETAAGFSEKKLSSAPVAVVSDVDSTLIEEEVIDQLAELAGVGAQVAEITDSAMRGELDFAQSLTQRVALLKGLRVEALEEVAQSLHVRPGAQKLIDWVHQHGGVFTVVSGGFTPVVASLARSLGIDQYKANDFEIHDGILTGRVAGDIVTAQTKEQFLTSIRGDLGAPVIALGDGANDIPMLRAADLGIAILAKPAVKQAIGSYLDWDHLDAVIGLAGFSDNSATGDPQH